MKEGILSVIRDGTDRKMKVKLTDDHLLLTELTNHLSPLSSTAIDSPVSMVSLQSTGVFSYQTSVSLSSSDSTSNKVSVERSKQSSSDETASNERVVTIKRQPGGGLGISVKGGAEHGIPVLISRVFTGQSDQTHLLQPGDAILAINGKRVESMLHDNVVSELRTCGPEVALTVRPFDGASHVLQPHSTANGQ